MFRARPFRFLWIIAIILAGAAAAVYSFTNDEARWMVFGSIGFFALGIISLVEAASDYVILDNKELRFRKTFRSVRILKSEIEKITWTKGGGVSIKRTSGSWVMVPDMGYDSQGMTNSLQAWLRAD